jgi:hypothetical protein
MIMQTIDVLDLAVLHMSPFERSHKKYKVSLKYGVDGHRTA